MKLLSKLGLSKLGLSKMRWLRVACVLPLMGATGWIAIAATALVGCNEQAASDLTIERLPDVSPSLPSAPTLPPPPHEVQYSDGSYSVYGLRRRGGTTMDTDVAVTGYIVEIYQPPECPEGQTCDVPAAPHLWIADTRDEADDQHRLMVAGYAENQAQIDEAIELAERGRYRPPDPESGELPIPVNFRQGTKVKVEGKFTRVSGSGFNISSGMIDYRGHEVLEPAEGQELLMVEDD